MLWCLKRPDLYGPGLLAHGLDPARLVLVTARRDDDILWAVEEGLRTGAPPRVKPGLKPAVVGEVGDRLPMAAGRRLQLAAERSGITALLLRRWRNAAEAAAERERPSAAVTRWRIGALPLGGYCGNDPGSGRPRWRVELLRVRGGVPGSWEVEVADATGHVCLSAELADRPAAPQPASRCRTSAAAGRLTRRQPFATVAEAGGRRLLAAVNPAAAAAGLAPGMPLADALSFLPGLATAPAEPAADAAALTRLAEWCGRYSPWTAPDGADGMQDRDHRLRPICGAARRRLPPIWRAGSRAGASPPHRDRRHARAPPGRWPALRPKPAGRPCPAPARRARARWRRCRSRLCGSIRRPSPGCAGSGCSRVGDLYPMPRDALARRFGETVAQRLDQALGDCRSRCRRSARRRCGGCGSALPSRSPTRPIWSARSSGCRRPGGAAGARGDGSAPARPRLSPRRRPGRAHPHRHRPAEPRPAPSGRPVRRRSWRRSIPVSASRT